MARRKDSVALFEVISRTRDRRREVGATVPAWMGRTPEEIQAGEPMPEPSAPEPHEMPVPKPHDVVLPTAPEPLFARSGGRFRLSVSPVTLAVAGIGLAVALVILFWLGRATAPSEDQAPEETPQEQPSQVPGETGNNDAGTKTGGPVAPSRREANLYYLVIQNLRSGADAAGNVTDHRLYGEAAEIVKFCESQGIRATVNARGRELIVWSLDGFASPSDAQAVRYAQNIEKIGKEYLAQSRRWDFRQRNAHGDFSPTFLRGR